MTCEEISQEKINFPVNISDTDLKIRCLNLLLKSGIPKNQVARVIPPSISNFLLKNLPQNDSTASLLTSSTFPRLKININELHISPDILRELLASHVQILTLENCSLPASILTTRDLLSAQIESSKIHSLIMDNVFISTNDEKFIKALGSLMERVTNLRFGSVTSNDSIIQTDEIFIKLARDHLSKNRNLIQVDLRGSNIDVVASCSRRNLQINFAAEMRRWARRLRGLAFETDMNIYRVMRILNRQCPLIKSICLRPRDQQTVSGVFDNLKSILDVPESQTQSVEPLLKLKSLCLCGNFRITDTILRGILPSLPALKYLNVAGCAVNFEQYWFYLPPTLEELILDECSRLELLKMNPASIRQLLRKCPNLIIYATKPKFESEELESLRGLALLNGANSMLSENYDIFGPPDDGLIAFELRIKEGITKCTSVMYGIPDFEKQVNELPTSELTPHLSNELGRIPWPQERDEFMPKLLNKQKFVYKSDYLSDRLLEQQERAQAFQNNLILKFKNTVQLYNETLDELGDRLDDKYLLPSAGLGTLAGLISWRSNKTAPLPIKIVYTAGGVFVSAFITHKTFRDNIKNRISSVLSDDLKMHCRIVDEKIGMFGAEIWTGIEGLFKDIKERLYK